MRRPYARGRPAGVAGNRRAAANPAGLSTRLYELVPPFRY
ncbi:hypothetical protein GCM10010156_59110 [Planobispora rosea]|uniref:Uncharacterized protein n=1 Tax=Planobispora rosea TaxID=35762 RepID=A0A8J3S2C9_PLARO|nr:hypothetical protein GCM10010156_59110 [Planobispora rosea]GIH87191.1 hypothetical protein Pro02_55990 [Planobispora rosea]